MDEPPPPSVFFDCDGRNGGDGARPTCHSRRHHRSDSRVGPPTPNVTVMSPCWSVRHTCVPVPVSSCSRTGFGWPYGFGRPNTDFHHHPRCPARPAASSQERRSHRVPAVDPFEQTHPRGAVRRDPAQHRSIHEGDRGRGQRVGARAAVGATGHAHRRRPAEWWRGLDTRAVWGRQIEESGVGASSGGRWDTPVDKLIAFTRRIRQRGSHVDEVRAVGTKGVDIVAPVPDVQRQRDPRTVR
jgi:hypothetical protein